MASNIPEQETPEAKQKRLEKELQSCNKALKQEPENPELLFNKGFILNQLGRFEEAVPLIEKSVDEEPSVRKYMQLGLAYTQIGKYEKALDVYDILLEFDNNNDEAHNCRGFVLSLMDMHEEAIDEYTKAIELNNDYTDARLNLGYSLDKLGKHIEAIDEYDEIISINPRDCCAYLNKGCSLSAIGNNKDALIAFEKSISIRPDDAFAHFMKGNTYHASGDFEMAFNEFDQAVKLDENYVEARYYRAEVAKFIGKEMEAISDYSFILSKTPDNVSILSEREKLYEKLERYDLAIKDCTAILSKNPDDISILSEREKLYEKLERYDLAVKDYTAILSKNPGGKSTRFSRGKLYVKMGVYDLAIKDYTAILSKTPSDYSTHLLRGKIRLHRGIAYEKMESYNKAIADFNYLIKNYFELNNNNNGQAYLELAHCQYKTGLYDDAESSLDSIKKRYWKIESAFDKYRFLKLQAKIYYSQKRYEDAFDAYNGSLKSLNKLQESSVSRISSKEYALELSDIEHDTKLCLENIGIPDWLSADAVPQLITDSVKTRMRNKMDISPILWAINPFYSLYCPISDEAEDILNRYAFIYIQKLIELSVSLSSDRTLTASGIKSVAQNYDTQIKNEVKEYVLAHERTN